MHLSAAIIKIAGRVVYDFQPNDRARRYAEAHCSRRLPSRRKTASGQMNGFNEVSDSGNALFGGVQ